MKEYRNVRQHPGESRRRWFSSSQFDLIVWLSDNDEPVGFELCYDKHSNERSLRWSATRGFQHMAVDDGEHEAGKYKETPILVADGFFDAQRVHAELAAVSHTLPAPIAAYVLSAIARHPAAS